MTLTDSNANFKNLTRTLLTRSITCYGRGCCPSGYGSRVFGTFSRKTSLAPIVEDNWFTFFEASIRGNARVSWCTARAQKVTHGECWRSATRLIKRTEKMALIVIFFLQIYHLKRNSRKYLRSPLSAVGVKHRRL